MKLKSQETVPPREEVISLDLVDDGLNMRTDLLTLTLQNEELCESIRANGGVLQPVGVYPIENRYKLIFGQRRVYCCRKLGMTVIRATIFPPPGDEADALVIGVQENVHRVDVEAVQYGESLRIIKERKGWTNEEVAKATSLNSVKVSRLLQLADETEAIKSLVKDDHVGVTTALELAKFTLEEQLALMQQVRSKEITRDELVDLRKAKSTPAAQSNKRIARATAQLDGGRSVTVAGETVTIDSFLECLELLLPKVRRAKQMGIQLKSFLSMVRDQLHEGAAQSPS